MYKQFITVTVRLNVFQFDGISRPISRLREVHCACNLAIHLKREIVVFERKLESMSIVYL